MRILHIITGLGRGGAESSLVKVATGLARRGHDVEVVSLTGPGPMAEPLRAANVSVQALERWQSSLILPGLVALGRRIDAFRPDVVQTWMYHADLLGGIAARRAGVPMAWNVRHGALDERMSTRTRWIARACARWSSRLPDEIVYASQASRREHERFGYASSRGLVIPNGYDLSGFARDEAARRDAREALGWKDGFVLGHVARYHPDKGHDLLLSALAKVRDALPEDTRIVLAGPGVDRANAALLRGVADAGLAGVVDLMGARDDVPTLMAAFDVFVLSSWSEGFPNVVAEAMAAGTPVVSTDAGDAALVVGDTGWIARRDSDDLARALRDALAAPSAQLRLRGNAARKSVAQRYSLVAVVDAYEQLYARLAARRKL